MCENHPARRIIAAELGCHEQKWKPEWVKNTFRKVKEDTKELTS